MSRSSCGTAGTMTRRSPTRPRAASRGPAAVQPIDHAGDYYSVRGPLNVPRSPQGHPLLVQAGSSEDGREFAARYAEAVFTAQQTLAEARDFYADLKTRVARLGRSPDEVKILPGIVPVLGATEADARELERLLDELIVPEYGLRALSEVLEVPVEVLALDEQLPGDIPDSETVEGSQSRSRLIVVARPPRAAHRPPAARTPGRRPRPLDGRRRSRADRRRAGGVVRTGSRRRLQRDGSGAPAVAGAVRRSRRAAAAATRAVPHRVRGTDPARALRDPAAGGDLRRRRPPQRGGPHRSPRLGADRSREAAGQRPGRRAAVLLRRAGRYRLAVDDRRRSGRPSLRCRRRRRGRRADRATAGYGGRSRAATWRFWPPAATRSTPFTPRPSPPAGPTTAAPATGRMAPVTTRRS